MKVMITGNQGFLGRQLQVRLPQNWQFVGLNRTHGDLTQLEIVRHQIDYHQPDVLIHAAAMADVRQCEQERELAYQSHVVLTETLAQVAQAAGIAFIFISSDQVYHKFTPEIKTEQTPPDPQTYYGQLKLAAEAKVQAFLPTAIILRLGWQCLFDDKQPHGLERLVARAAQQPQPLTYHPLARQYPCDVRFTCSVIEAACRGQLQPGIYNVTQPTPQTLGTLFLFGLKRFGLSESEAMALLQADETRENVQLCARPQALERSGFPIWPHEWEKE